MGSAPFNILVICLLRSVLGRRMALGVCMHTCPCIVRRILLWELFYRLRRAMLGDAARQDALDFDAGMKYNPDYNFLLTPFVLYGLPACYLVAAISGHFLMRNAAT